MLGTSIYLFYGLCSYFEGEAIVENEFVLLFLLYFEEVSLFAYLHFAISESMTLLFTKLESIKKSIISILVGNPSSV